MQTAYFRGLAIALAGLMLVCAPAFSQTAGKNQPTSENHRPPGSPKSGGSVSMGLVSRPIYQGSDAYRATVGASFGYQWENGLSVGTNGIGWQLSQRENTQFGIGLGFSAGRKEGDSNGLRGMGDINDQVTFRGYVNTSVARGVAVGAALEMGSGNAREGVLLQLATTYTLPLGPAWSLSLDAGAAIANADYMGNFFGVNTLQAAASGYATYNPAGGIRDVSMGARLNYALAPKWILTVGVSGVALGGSAQNSPLVRQPNSAAALMGITSRF